MFVFHRDELHAHTLFGATSLDSGTSAYLTCRRINEQLNERSNRRRIRCTDEQSAQAEVVHYRNRSFVEPMPSDDRPFRSGKARINTTFAIWVQHGRAGSRSVTVILSLASGRLLTGSPFSF